MSLRRIAGIAVAAAVVSGAGLLLSAGTSAAAPTSPTPITLEATGLSSTACPTLPVGFYDTIALKPTIAVQFKGGLLIGSLTIKPAPNSTNPDSSTTLATVPTTGATAITFSRAATYTLTWQTKTPNPLGAAVVTGTRDAKLVINSHAAGCKVAVVVPTPSVSASALPSPITSAVNGGLGAAASGANGALGPINSAIGSLPTAIPTLPPISGVPSLPPLPGSKPPATSAPAGGGAAPGTIYKPSGPTVADRTVPDGYGSGSGVGGTYVPVTGNPIIASGQHSTSNGSSAAAASSASPGVKNGGSPRTVELASNRPRSALGALPTLAVILAILALSGATAFYARTFLLQPAEAQVKASTNR